MNKVVETTRRLRKGTVQPIRVDADEYFRKKTEERVKKEREFTDFTMTKWWILKPHSAEDEICHIWLDRDILANRGDKPLKLSSYQIDDEIEDFENLTSSKKFSKADLGFKKAREREKNLNKLKKLITEDGIETVQQAYRHFEGIKTKRTIYNYLYIIGHKLIDEENGRLYGSDEPHYEDLYIEKKAKTTVQEYKYYSDDPAKGGKEITKAEYVALRDKLIKEYDIVTAQSKKARAKGKRKSTGYASVDERMKQLHELGEVYL